MSLWLFSVLAAAVTVAGFATVVWISSVAGRMPPWRKRLLAFGLLAAYAAVLVFRPVEWAVIDLAVLAGAIGGVLLMEGALQAAAAVAVFLSVAAVVDVLSMAGGLSRIMIEGFRTGSSRLLLYVALVTPVRGSTIPIVGISDLFVGGSAAVALLRFKLRPIAVMGTMSAGFLAAVAYGLWRGPTPALPFSRRGGLALILAPRSTFALPLAYKGSGRHKRGIRSRKNGRSAGTDDARSASAGARQDGPPRTYHQGLLTTRGKIPLAAIAGRELVPRFPGFSVIYMCRELWEQPFV